MQNSEIDKLRIAANQFYLGLYLDKPTLSDEEYDRLAKEYGLDKVRDLVEWDEVPEVETIPEKALSKVVADNFQFHKLAKELCGDGEYYLTPKYDGCAIKAYYENGKLQRIISSPDGTRSLNRTKNFWNIFPHQIDKDITYLRGEVLVDYKEYGELSRNKANGLVNSKYKGEEIESECVVVFYDCGVKGHDELDYYTRIDYLSRIPTTNKFRRYQIITEDVNQSHYVTEDGFEYQLDGMVLYSPQMVKGLKYYFTTSEQTTIRDISYQLKDNGSRAAVLELEPIELNGKNVKRVSAGSINKMFNEGLGIGAVVKVALSKGVIPKITEVISRSENFMLPSCGCGTPLDEDCVFGAVLKCNSTDFCEERFGLWKPQFDQWYLDEFNDPEDVDGNMKSQPEWFAYCLFIDRWDPYDNQLEGFSKEDLYQDLIKCTGASRLFDWVTDYFRFTEAQAYQVELNIRTSWEILKEYLNKI